MPAHEAVAASIEARASFAADMAASPRAAVFPAASPALVATPNTLSTCFAVASIARANRRASCWFCSAPARSASASSWREPLRVLWWCCWVERVASSASTRLSKVGTLPSVSRLSKLAALLFSCTTLLASMLKLKSSLPLIRLLIFRIGVIGEEDSKSAAASPPSADGFASSWTTAVGGDCSPIDSLSSHSTAADMFSCLFSVLIAGLALSSAAENEKASSGPSRLLPVSGPSKNEDNSALKPLPLRLLLTLLTEVDRA
mmetsp:Transcript_32905/g.65566  ORF Transcript_32905/g.65566 Transcript_32905/m.65566 type:complete len:259 (-) Transcript_32905:849-1625(-)